MHISSFAFKNSQNLAAEAAACGPPVLPDCTSDDLVVVIDARHLFRECMVRCLEPARRPGRVEGYATIGKWLETSPKWISPPVVILCCSGRTGQMAEQIARLSDLPAETPYIVAVSDNDDSRAIVDALGQGLRGYIPTSTTFLVAQEALRLVKVGGVFAPADRLIRARIGPADTALRGSGVGQTLFTPRQVAVLESIRRGKPNKIIAYELVMRESTVKVHVRTIMKKLKASNRTEVAFLAEQMKQAQQHVN